MRRIAPAALLALASSIAAFGTGCSAQEVDAADADQGEIVQAPSRGPKVCAAVRGNGHYVVTHFASLARIVEHYGVVDGMAGGSSGSLSTFIYDSMLKNDAIRSCSLFLKTISDAISTSKQMVTPEEFAAEQAAAPAEAETVGAGA